ncbi:MAG TPA: YciI family protein [Candidatus Limnocylindria bacterium]|nr:YciI family protein [Candidatus Limnocylindria bacterium]
MPKYVLMFVGDDDEWAAQPADRRQKSYAEIGAWWDDLSKKGVIKGGHELTHQRTATTVRRVNGQMKVTDGPFVESKESVGGFALIEVADLDAALAVAKSWPGGDVEVRPIVEH